MCFVLLLKKVSLIAFARAMAMAFVKSSMIQKLCKKASLFRPKPKYLTNNHMTILLLHFFHLFLRQKKSHLESPKAKIISQSQQSFTFFILLHIFHSLFYSHLFILLHSAPNQTQVWIWTAPFKIEQTDRPTHNLQIYKCGQNIWENGVRWEWRALGGACAGKGVRWEGRALGRACAGKGVRWKSVRLEGRSLKRACSENGMRANIASLVFCPQIFLNEITRHLGRIETILTLKSIKCDPKFWHCGNFISEKKIPKESVAV